MGEHMPGIKEVLDGRHLLERVFKVSPPVAPHHRHNMNVIFFGLRDPAYGGKRHQTYLGPVVYTQLTTYATTHGLKDILKTLAEQRIHIENCMFPLSVSQFHTNANGKIMQQRDTKCEIFFSCHRQVYPKHSGPKFVIAHQSMWFLNHNLGRWQQYNFSPVCEFIPYSCWAISSLHKVVVLEAKLGLTATSSLSELRFAPPHQIQVCIINLNFSIN